MSEDLNLQQEILSGYGIEAEVGDTLLERVQSLYSQVRPEIGHHILKPNVVLMLSGLKGAADLTHMPRLLPEEMGLFGYIFNSEVEQNNHDPSNSENFDLFLLNKDFKDRRKKALQKNPLYKSLSDPQGDREWRFHQTVMFEEGIALGYPLIAIKGFINFYENKLRGNIKKINEDPTTYRQVDGDTIYTFAPLFEGINIEDADIGAYPHFMYEQGEEGDIEMSSYLTLTRAALQTVYNSEWYQEISHTSDFLAERQNSSDRYEHFKANFYKRFE